jgi:isoleucyl-tRNA synthetase
LSFLSEEVYGYLPASNLSEKEDSVFLEDFPKADKGFENDLVAQDYEKLFELRSVVSKAIEELRASKKIKGSLEARVNIPSSLLEKSLWEKYKNQLAEFFIVSDVTYSEDSKNLDVDLAEGEKCPRCWHIESLKDHSCGEKICGRCFDVLDEIL